MAGHETCKEGSILEAMALVSYTLADLRAIIWMAFLPILFISQIFKCKMHEFKFILSLRDNSDYEDKVCS